MSAFNKLRTETNCPRCGHRETFEIQFKYGDVWQHDYGIGDRLIWGGNDTGTPGLAEVHVQGISGPCPNCGVDLQLFKVIIKNDQIIDMQPASEDEYDAMEPSGFRLVSP